MIKKSSNGTIGAIHTNSKTTPKYRRIQPYEKDIKTGKILNDTLHDIYIQDGETNTYEITQSHKKECDIYEILRTCQASGTLEPLGHTTDDQYADITGIPNSIAETLEKLPSQADIDELTKKVKELQAALKTKEPEEVKESAANE